MKLNIFSTTGGSLKKYFKYVTTDFGQFVAWMNSIDDYIALDLETNMVDSVLDRRITTIALYYKDTVWIIFFQEVTEDQQKQLVTVLNSHKYIIQNAIFEIKTFKRYGVDLNRFYDTFIVEKTLNMGLDGAKNSLDAILYKYLGISISKELQTSFGVCAEITDDQIDYASQDVIHLHKVKDLQEEHVAYHDRSMQSKLVTSKNRGLKKTIWWNTEFVKVIADLEYEGMKLDIPNWETLYKEALPLVDKATDELDTIVKRDFYNRAVADGFLYAKDTFIPKLFTSSARKKELLNILYPDIEKVSQLELKIYLSKNDPDWPEDVRPTSKKVDAYVKVLDVAKPKYIAIKLLLMQRELETKKLFYVNYKDELVKRELLILKDTVNINWGSPVQRMTIFKWIVPELTSTERKYMEEVALQTHNQS